MGTPRRFLVLALLASALIAPTLGAAPTTAQMRDEPAPAAPVVTSTGATAVAAPLPTRRLRLLTNDPQRHPHAIADRLVALVDGTPAGAQIDVVTYYLGSERLAGALRRAVQRGVTVHLLLAGDRLSLTMRAGARLVSYLRAHPGAGGWVQRAHGSTRGRGDLMHQKSWRFSRTGSEQWVVVTGSYNPSPRSDVFAYAHMVEVSGDEEIYRTFADIEQVQHRARRVPDPMVQDGGGDWSAYFLPIDRGTARADPVMRRLAAIPPGRATTIRIEMYSMWGERGDWIARRLAAMARRGTRIVLLAGPYVAPPIQHRLRAAGVRVEPACFGDGTYTHAKEMSASWGSGEQRVWWTWLGSDNWTSGGMFDDESVLGFEDRGLYQSYGDAFEVVARRRGVTTTSCHAVRD